MPTRRRRLRKEGKWEYAPFAGREFDVVLPAQFLHTKVLTPEQALMLAVMEQAVHDLQVRPGALNRQEYERGRNGKAVHPEQWQPTPRENAIAWFESDETDWPLYFVNICDAFGWDIGCMRAALLQGRAA